MSRSQIDYRGVCGDPGYRPEVSSGAVLIKKEGDEVIERELRPLSVAMLEPQHCRDDIDRDREAHIAHYPQD